MFRWLVNSLIVSVGTTLGVLILCSLAGYGFARLDFPFRRTLFVFVLLGLAIPEQAVILPQHQLFAELRLHNSYPGLILPGLVGPFGVFFMTQYMRAIPRELDEAAMLDGASRLHALLEGAAAADPAGAGDARRVHLPRLVERLLVAAHLGDPKRHVHADRRPRRGADELCADLGPRLPDGAGGVRLDPDLHRLHHCSRSRSSARWPGRRCGEAAAARLSPRSRSPAAARSPAATTAPKSTFSASSASAAPQYGARDRRRRRSRASAGSSRR